LSQSLFDPKIVKALIFDFDGVFTDNSVLVGSNGIEMLKFSKLDSLGLDLFRSYLLENNLQMTLAIVSKETSEIVSIRASKLKLECFQSVSDKWQFISQSLGLSKDQYVYFGNDLNDKESMEKALISFAPSDAHHEIKRIATHTLTQRGGDGFVRSGLELLMENAKKKGE
jgi:YrbI family 3-deoxy-D-manno-octulosonate 8-phosphate phosphatase